VQDDKGIDKAYLVTVPSQVNRGHMLLQDVADSDAMLEPDASSDTTLEQVASSDMISERKQAREEESDALLTCMHG
jgi:hypothetical protein